MELHIYLSALILIALLTYSINKWLLKGQLFHPGLIYTIVNSSLFIIFAFGPYTYNLDIPWSYYYVYTLTLVFFVIGIVLGEQKRRKGNFSLRSFKIKRKQLLIIFLLVLMPLLVKLLGSGLFSENFSLEETVLNRFQDIDSGRKAKEISILEYVLSFLFLSINSAMAFNFTFN
jgi:hypothetical protein